MYKKTLLPFLYCACALVLRAQTNDEISPSEFYGIHIGKLPKYSVDVWQKEVDKRMKEREAMVAFYVHELRSEKDPEKQMRICFLLGNFRANKAAPALADVIDLHNPDFSDAPRGGLPMYGPYPAVSALVRIGLPAIRTMIERLETEQDNTKRHLEVSVIREICGEIYGIELTTSVLEKAAAEQTDPDKKANLNEAVELSKQHRTMP